ncbi:BA14K family protein [Brevundimonas sp. LM2]|uniref:BA14K family protein n=1 Tax=Brevundimonas sp. LM2 TaxID=1938605 RepID=UPI000987065E|nr:BA14K family protein [Brevundimonas sp. LM2]
MKAFAFAAIVLTVAAPAAAQSWHYPDQARSYSSYSRHGYDYNGQRDRPGDYRCDAYWDRGRDDCGAGWRDQRTYRSQGHGYGYGHDRYSRYGQGGGYVYQPYNQGTQYYGSYGRPDQVYPGGGYGGQVGGYRDHGRSGYCAARYRSYDPRSGYYRAYSGQLIYCG